MPTMRSDLRLIPLSQVQSVLRQRQLVLRETLDRMRNDYQGLHQRATQNLARWRMQRQVEERTLATRGRVELYQGDWGEVTAELTAREGELFAALNMANAYVAGGAYQRGTAAQEENMFRRTDCHFALRESELLPSARDQVTEPRYTPEMTDLLNAKGGRVYLDIEQSRICLRGPEILGAPGEGYAWLNEMEIFPFYELRAAAVDLRYGQDYFKPKECKRRFNALLDTLKEAGVEHAVLGAHGCGAFENPSQDVARCYAQVLNERRGEFSLIAFAIYHAGYGPNNYEIFEKVFKQEGI